MRMCLRGGQRRYTVASQQIRAPRLARQSQLPKTHFKPATSGKSSLGWWGSHLTVLFERHLFRCHIPLSVYNMTGKGILTPFKRIFDLVHGVAKSITPRCCLLQATSTPQTTARLPECRAQLPKISSQMKPNLLRGIVYSTLE